VVLPIAPVVERSGTYLKWEGRRRRFDTTMESTGALPDCRVLDTLAVEMDVDLFTQTVSAAGGDLDRLGMATGRPATSTDVAPARVAELGPGQAILATWRQLLDNGSLQDGEPHLAATAKAPVARLSENTATALGVRFGELVRVYTEHGSISVPAVPADVPDGVVWLPANSGPSTVHRTLSAGHGDLVGANQGSDA